MHLSHIPPHRLSTCHLLISPHLHLHLPPATLPPSNSHLSSFLPTLTLPSLILTLLPLTLTLPLHPPTLTDHALLYANTCSIILLISLSPLYSPPHSSTSSPPHPLTPSPPHPSQVEMLSHYGHEHYCPLSLLRVLGASMIQVFQYSEEQKEQQSGQNQQIVIPASGKEGK